jgi:hypothetical protein
VKPILTDEQIRDMFGEPEPKPRGVWPMVGVALVMASGFVMIKFLGWICRLAIWRVL